MASLNQASLLGYVGHDPKISVTQIGKKMAQISVATTESGYTTRDGREVAPRTEWHNIVLWGHSAEFVERFVRKGSSVFVQGRIRTRAYDDKQGQRRYVTEIDADTVQLLDRIDKEKPVNPNSTNNGGGNNFEPPF